MRPHFDVEHIPDELKALPRWCGFQLVPQPGGKVKKLPLVSGKPGKVLASCSDPSTLRPFDVAVRDAKARGLALGFAFSPDLPYFFIDADDAISPDGDDVREDVKAVRDALSTYTEVSISGTGLHIIGKGAFPEHASNRPAPEGCKPLERYPLHGGRFCVLTGDVVPGYAHIVERSRRLAELFPPRPVSSNGHTPYSPPGGELLASEGEAIVAWAKPYWVDGRRHPMALHLSGYLGKQGVSREQACRIIERCAEGDGDPGAKVHACHDSFDALEAGLEVSGWHGLIDVCGISERDLEPLNRVVSGFWRRTHPKDEGQESGTLLPNYRLASEIETERIAWIWYGFLAEGKITLLDGVPKLGKSTLTADFAARVSRGLPFPGLAVPRSSRGVVLLSAEDGEADTIKPRLEAAGADLGKVAIVSGIPMGDGTEGWVHLDEHLAPIEALIRTLDAQLVVIDPLVAYLGSKNAYKDQDMRAILGPVKAMAERTRCAIIIIRHLNKSASTDIIMRGGGSVGISGAARLGMLVARDPENDEARVLAQSVTNLTREQPSLRFSLAGVEGTDVARIVWDDDPAPYTSIELLEATPDVEEKGARGEAMEFLRDALSEGERDVIALVKDAKGLGIAKRTLDRAKAALGVQSVKRGGQSGNWVWLLPQGCHDGTLGNVGNLSSYVNNNWHPLKSDKEGCQGCQDIQHSQRGNVAQERMPWDDDVSE